jgi:drug/metabolite transporter (DMT)-like permease
MTPAFFIQTAMLTFLSLTAFAANAIICRWALDAGMIDPVSFTNLRLASGAMMLFFVVAWVSWKKRPKTPITRPGEPSVSKGSWRAAVVLFLYAITFSYGYVAISTATGALVLAAVVQLTMIGYALRAGDRLHGAEWIGVALALIGLLYLVYPKLTTPSWWGLVMVVASAYTWALYTLNGRKSKNPLQDTAYNFFRTLPLVAVAAIAFIPFMSLSWQGVALAVFSGAITSGLGYILWYKALPRISSSLASASQLLVPLMAAFGAAWLINEPITLRFVLSAALMLGGLGLVLWGRHRHRQFFNAKPTIQTIDLKR